MADHYAFARLTHNSNGWIKPSGWAHKSPNKRTFEADYGFGFEEWLFNSDYSIDDYQYGYVESLRADRQQHPLALYTFKYAANRRGKAERILVATIDKWEHIDMWGNATVDDQIIAWCDTMVNDVINILGNDTPERQSTMQINLHAQYPEGHTKPLKNIRFKLNKDNVNYLYDKNIDVSPVIKTGFFVTQVRSRKEIHSNILNILR
ncbi:hypothetical protein [uncultured Spirosoma sp.]|uniref:hypothetical protein n=1 Tax=uncultured Spirosoma sp. TaxID=278208 RepID=UPI0025849AA5|nr:hypothetical protein [uncultured Spirosoma sp.]